MELSTDLLSTPKGFLAPRLSSVQRDGIILPATGLLIYNLTTNQFEYNSGNSVAPSWLPLTATDTEGVTSVALSLPSIFSVSGSPVTSSGTLSATFNEQNQNTVFAGPSGANGGPSFRALVSGDIPGLDASKITTGTLPVARGGTGVTSVTGIVSGNGTNGFTGRTITGTTNQITVSNGNGATANPTLSIANNPVLPGTASLTIPSGTTAARPATPSNGMMRYNSTTGKVEFYQGSNWGNSVLGSGTANYLPKFTESTTLGNSILYSNDTTVAIGTTAPSSKAVFEINSTSQGFLPPRMTLAQRDAIISPPQGLIVYVTDAPDRGMYIYDTSPTAGWVLLQTIATDAIGGIKTIVKSSVSQNGTNTLADDSELSISVGANQVWNIEGFVGATNSDAGPDLRIAFTVPTGGVMGIGVRYTSGTTSNAFSLTSSGVYVTTIPVANNAATLIQCYGTISTGSTAGTVKFQFSQNTAKLSAPVSILSNSFLKATRIK